MRRRYVTSRSTAAVRHPRVLQQHAALPVLLSAAEPDPLVAGLGARG